jgi:hypothetical protein
LFWGLGTSVPRRPVQNRGENAVYSVVRAMQGQGAFPAWRYHGDPAPWVGLAEAHYVLVAPSTPLTGDRKERTKKLITLKF